MTDRELAQKINRNNNWIQISQKLQLKQWLIERKRWNLKWWDLKNDYSDSLDSKIWLNEGRIELPYFDSGLYICWCAIVEKEKLGCTINCFCWINSWCYHSSPTLSKTLHNWVIHLKYYDHSKQIRGNGMSFVLTENSLFHLTIDW